MKHLVSIHVNAVRIGFTREGEKRVGNFKDPGQREFCGQQLLAAVSRFVAAGSGGGDSELKELERRADARLASAARMIGGMGSIFQARLFTLRRSQPGFLVLEESSDCIC